jgi:hypothetical protein
MALGNTPINELDAFSYLESAFNREGGTEEDVKKYRRQWEHSS